MGASEITMAAGCPEGIASKQASETCIELASLFYRMMTELDNS